MNGLTANFGMYDGGELTAANDVLWSAIAARITDVDGVPTQLDRTVGPPGVWLDDRLLLGQACGYPFAKRLAERLVLAGTPDYTAPGCEPGAHRSFIVVAARTRTRSLRQLRGVCAAVNDTESMTGRHLLGEALAPAPGAITSTVVSGSHARSLALVASGGADVAAIDCITYAHLARLSPEMVAETRTIAWTRTVPALPFVTARSLGAKTAARVASALRSVMIDPELADVRRVLRLRGLTTRGPSDYAALLPIAARADSVFLLDQSAKSTPSQFA